MIDVVRVYHTRYPTMLTLIAEINDTVAKYFAVNEQVGARMQSQGMAMQAQQAQQEKKKGGGWFS